MYAKSQCNFKSDSGHDLNTHIKSTHKEFDKVYYNCDKCDYKAGDVTKIETHIETTHVEKHKYWERNEEYA